MRTAPLSGPIDGATIHPVRTTDDAEAAIGWLTEPRPFVALDTETTGLAYESKVRLIQYGNCSDSWVFDPHQWPALIEMLDFTEIPLVCHNAPFDLLHVARLLDPDRVVDKVTALMGRVTDTSLLAHLVDPREKRHGGTGHSLKPLSEYWVDPNAPDGDAALKEVFRSLGLSVADGYAQVPLDCETYVIYSGLDTILTARLYEALSKEVANLGLDDLSAFEHRTQQITTAMTARGIPVNLPYAHALSEEMAAEKAIAEGRAEELGVTNCQSTAQVAQALIDRGSTLTETTPSGAWKVDRLVLEGLDDELARQVLAAKNASKALSSWVDPLIEAAWPDGRVHPRIRSLAARTGRQSISNPPLQQLPAGDHRIRACLQADEGHHLVSADFSQIEMRVLAALANEESMISAFVNGEDLHDVTASRLFGPTFTPAQRRLAKGVSFGVIYGGGPDTLSRQSGVTKADARAAIDRFQRAFPRVKRWSEQLIETVRFGEPLVITPTGRRIPVDREYAYRAVNYSVQSLAADLFKGSIIQLDDAGMGPNLSLPIHDEVLAMAPIDEAEDFAHAMAEVMSGDLGPVPITAQGEVVGDNWGRKYQSDPIHTQAQSNA